MLVTLFLRVWFFHYPISTSLWYQPAALHRSTVSKHCWVLHSVCCHRALLWAHGAQHRHLYSHSFPPGRVQGLYISNEIHAKWEREQWLRTWRKCVKMVGSRQAWQALATKQLTLRSPGSFRVTALRRWSPKEEPQVAGRGLCTSSVHHGSYSHTQALPVKGRGRRVCAFPQSHGEGLNHFLTCQAADNMSIPCFFSIIPPLPRVMNSWKPLRKKTD